MEKIYIITAAKVTEYNLESNLMMTQAKFGSNWPSGFRGRNLQTILLRFSFLRHR
jgi:hypothetical protein